MSVCFRQSAATEPYLKDQQPFCNMVAKTQIIPIKSRPHLAIINQTHSSMMLELLEANENTSDEVKLLYIRKTQTSSSREQKTYLKFSQKDFFSQYLIMQAKCEKRITAHKYCRHANRLEDHARIIQMLVGTNPDKNVLKLKFSKHTTPYMGAVEDRWSKISQQSFTWPNFGRRMKSNLERLTTKQAPEKFISLQW
jgi:hypothetical protein